jgi:hypothetical protein
MSVFADKDGEETGVEQSHFSEEYGKNCKDLLKEKKGLGFTKKRQLAEAHKMLGKYLLFLAGAEEGSADFVVE